MKTRKPLHNNVTVRVIPTLPSEDLPMSSSGALYLPGDAKSEANNLGIETGEVLAIGIGEQFEGRFVYPSVRVGQIVEFYQNDALVVEGPLDPSEPKTYVINDRKILTVLE